MNKPFKIIPWLILLIPFIILAYFYNSLADEILIARSFLGNEAILAPKSFFTVFRVPLIEIVCAVTIEIMRQKFAAGEDAGKYTNGYIFWSILLYTVSFKSLLQALEIISPGNIANLFYFLTLGIVISGIILALFKIREVISKLRRDDRKFSLQETAALVFLLLAYLGLAIVPIFVFK
jgi:hypothetical protein